MPILLWLWKVKRKRFVKSRARAWGREKIISLRF